MTDFIITTEPGEHHHLQLSWTNNRSLIYISTNHRTMGMSPAMAEELMRGLMALLRGPFTRAISESALTQEQDFAEARLRRSQTTSESVRSTPRPKTELDML